MAVYKPSGDIFVTQFIFYMACKLDVKTMQKILWWTCDISFSDLKIEPLTLVVFNTTIALKNCSGKEGQVI